MDVNRDNFYDVLPQIVQEINNADFVAIDGEFTGILPFDKMNYFDTPAQRYLRSYDCDRHYMMVQVGLAMVRCTNPAENRYTLKAYNFYLFPENETDAFDFRAKTSSLQFLAANHFDFVQLFLKGIPFVCKTTHLRKLRESPQILSNRRSNRPNPDGNFNKIDTSQISDDGLLKMTMTGFSEVMWKLQESGKPVVGHNLHMDVLHMINQFFTPLPPTYEEYKSIVKSLFPKLIDTKTLASTSIFQEKITNTALNAVYKAVRESDFPACRFEAPDNFRYAVGEHEHTAGYDATCTAVCMTKMMAFVAEKTSFKENPMEHSLINSLIGKLFYMRSYDLRYSDFLNDDALPDRSGVFYIKHPSSMTTANLREFTQQFNVLSYDRWDPTTYVVALSMKNDTVETMLKKLRTNDKNLLISSYAEYHQLDPSTIKIKEPNHLLDVDPTNRRSNKRVYLDKDAPEQETMEISTVTTVEAPSTTNQNPPTASPTIAQLLEQKEKASGAKKRKIFDYNDEW